MKKYFIYTLIALCHACIMHAEFSLLHQPGLYGKLQDNGMQKTHTDYQIMYAKPGETVYLYRPEKATFVGYVRWYCYDTDMAVPSWYSASDSPTGVAMPRIQSTWQKDTITATLKFKDRNEYGWFGYALASDGKATTNDANYVEIKYTMHDGDSVYRIACDQGIWNDYYPSTWNNNAAMTEPTLSKRIIFEIRPASWIADSLELCKDLDGTNNKYLEEHNLIAPIDRQLYIGPDYMCLGSGAGTKISPGSYVYYALTNYYYINSQSNITPASDKNKWKWYVNGVYNKSGFSTKSAQFAAFSSSVPDTVIYTLKYNSATNVYFNVAKFTVIYLDTAEVGPSTNIPAPTKNMEKIYEENFNYSRPNTTNFAFWDGYLDVDESTYGYYTQNINWINRQSKSEQKKITWSEYAITNRKSVWVPSGQTAPQVYQHVDGTGNVANNAKEGYMLYCDGSQQPGLVFNLKVHANLCPGSTMYFYAWICDASSTGDSNKSAPNIDFIVTGIDDYGKEHPLTTFTTGEIGINSGMGSMDRAIWYQIKFPVKFTSETTYPTYRLRITNKSTSSDGNDFAIDDIRIYVEKPPVMPIQASASDCIDKAVDSIRSYIRVDYKEINYDGQPLYYQWREEDKIVRNAYYNIDSASTTFGKINILPDEDITANDTCSDILSFDKKFRDTETPVVKYIEEPEGSGHYVMYIAMPMTVRINHEYTSFVSLSPSTLGDRSGCGTFADMLVAGGTRITINDKITFGDSVITVCGHRTYTLNIVLTKVIQDEAQGELKIDTTHCKADWLIGDSSYINANPDIYRYSFDEIERGLGFYRQHVPSAIQMVKFLTNHGLLILDTASIVMNPGVSLSYTALPIDGSAGDKKVCTSPRFLHINPAVPASNMMEVGNKEEDLPDIIKSRPRVVRISNARKEDGHFYVPLYLKGHEELYEIDSIYMVSSTNQNWMPIKLNTDHSTVSPADTLLLSSDALHLLEAGYDYTFHIAFKGENSEDRCDRGYTYFTLRIIPDIVTWYGNEWNVDSNWDYFIPMKETSVILMDTDYVVSFNNSSLAMYDINYTENECNNIYFPDTASVYGQELIRINGKAFVDIREYAWKWTLTSVPIKGVVSGDFFVSLNDNLHPKNPFVVAPINQTVGMSADDRTKWKLYRKVFDTQTTKWQSSTNSLNDKIEQGATDMIGVDCEDENDTIIIRLPKQDNIYNYYSSNTWLNKNVSVIRNEDYGKPVWNGDAIIELKETYNSVYLFGNPTFGYIDITKLIEDNSDKFTGRYYFEKHGSAKIPKSTEDIAFNGNVYEDEYHKLLPPYRGILLEGKYESNSIIINLTTNHINITGSAPKRRAGGNDNVATNIEYVGTESQLKIYDIMGRYVGTDFDNLTNGIYIIFKGNGAYKVFIER